MGYDVGNILGSAQRARLLALQQTARQLDGVSARLASGKKVSSAIDNPSSFFLARSLQSRSADLSRLLDGIGQNIRTIEEADHGIEAQLSILDLAESYLEGIEQKFLAGEVSTSTGDPENETYVTFAGSSDLVAYDASQDFLGSGTVTVPSEDEVAFSGNFWKRKAFNYTVTADTVLVFEFRSTAIPEIAAIGFDNDTNYGNDNDRFFVYGTQLAGLPISAPVATYDYSGSGEWERIEIPIGTFFTGNYAWINFVHDDDAMPYGNASYRNITLREGPEQAGPVIADSAASFEAEYKKILGQFDNIARDAQYRGVNLLGGDDMTTYFNRDLSNSLLTEGIDSTIDGLGLSIEDFNSITVVREKLSQVRDARGVLRSYASTIATDLNVIQAREDFTRGQINVAEAGAHDLVDADLNEEGAKFLALQTLQQIEISMLAMRQTTILSLFA